jgi:hypothetical protein
VLLVLSFPASTWLWRTGRRRLAAEDPRLLALQRDTLARLERGRLAPRPPRWLGTAVLAAGILCLLPGLGLLAFQLRTLLAYPDRPVPTTLAQAAPGAWVAVPDVALDCATEVRVGDGAYVLGHAAAGRPVVVRLEAGGCAGAAPPLVGVHRALHPNLRRSLEQAAFPLPDGPITSLCTTCGPRDDLLGVVISALLAALGGWVTWKGAALRRTARAR